jgi:hypothetical protein
MLNVNSSRGPLSRLSRMTPSFEVLNSVLIMRSLQKKVDLVGRSIAQRTLCLTSSQFERLRERFYVRSDDLEEFDDIEDSFDQLRQLLLKRKEEASSAASAIICTAGVAAQMAFYGSLMASIGASPVPLENWNFFALLLGPWWSSSHWVDWICFDFFRSSLSRDLIGVHSDKETKFKQWAKWISSADYLELNQVYKEDRKCFYLCAAFVLCLYAMIWKTMPSTNRILLEKMSSSESIRVFKERNSTFDLFRCLEQTAFQDLPSELERHVHPSVDRYGSGLL